MDIENKVDYTQSQIYNATYKSDDFNPRTVSDYKRIFDLAQITSPFIGFKWIFIQIPTSSLPTILHLNSGGFPL